MFPAAEYVTMAEHTYRRERAAAEFARVGRVRSARRKRQRPRSRVSRTRQVLRPAR